MMMSDLVRFCQPKDAPYTKTGRFHAGHIQSNALSQGPMMKTGEKSYILWPKILTVWGTKNPMNGPWKRGLKTSKYNCIII